MLIEIIIPTYNRLDFLKETLVSVLNQNVGSGNSLKVVVSDNSTNDVTEHYFSNINFENVKYLRISPSLSVLKHLDKILEEVNGDYFMVFHDDDVMCRGMLLNLISQMSDDNAAVAPNAFILREEKKTKNVYLKNVQNIYEINDKKNLLLPYLKRKGSVPFPGYLYKKTVAQINLDKRYGKHIDVYFLSKVLNYGSIKILNEPNYYYRIHNGQDSFVSDFVGKLKLIKYIYQTCNLKRTDDIVVACRLYNIYDDLRIRIQNKNYNNKIRIYNFMLLCIYTMNFSIVIKLSVRIIKSTFK